MTSDPPRRSDALATLAALSLGFRSRYLRSEQVVAQLRAWANAWPDMLTLRTLAQTPEGRPIVVAILGDESAPAVWVDANMHAGELCGTHVALGVLEDLLALRLGAAPSRLGIPDAIAPRLRELTAFICPRVSPDGAEAVLTDGRYVRSLPRDGRIGQSAPRWVHRDVDGDGLAQLMRVEDAAGEWVSLPEMPAVLVPRQIDDTGPFYALYPEGHIEGWDGFTIPEATYLSDTQTDLNRNFPYGWQPEPAQAGAGDYPCSEPESRALVDFAGVHPNIFVWLNLHTFGGVFIRPLGDAPDAKMDAHDLGVFRQIEAWNTEATGYPTVSGYHEFLYEPDKPLRGDLTEWAYHQRGALAYVAELWDLPRQAGIEVRRPFIDTFQRMTRADLARIAQWDRDHNASRAVRPWRRFEHPQLGPVELGGIDPRFGLQNPPPERLDELCRAHARAFLRVASLPPVVRLDQVRVVRLDAEVSRVEIVVRNHGYLATYGAHAARALPWNEPLQARLACHDGVALVAGDARQSLGHLEGWGRGAHDSSYALSVSRSRGNVQARRAQWVVRGAGEVTVSVSSVRVGRVERRARVG